MKRHRCHVVLTCDEGGTRWLASAFKKGMEGLSEIAWVSIGDNELRKKGIQTNGGKGVRLFKD